MPVTPSSATNAITTNSQCPLGLRWPSVQYPTSLKVVSSESYVISVGENQGGSLIGRITKPANLLLISVHLCPRTEYGSPSVWVPVTGITFYDATRATRAMSMARSHVTGTC